MLVTDFNIEKVTNISKLSPTSSSSIVKKPLALQEIENVSHVALIRLLCL